MFLAEDIPKAVPEHSQCLSSIPSTKNKARENEKGANASRKTEITKAV